MKFLCSILLVFLTLPLPVLGNEEEILRLQKGEYYYHYLTGDFPSAMNQLSQWRNTGGTIADEADVMEAAMLLSLGLHNQAQEIFEKIQQAGSSASSQSWFYLARRWFELGEYYSALYSIQFMDAADLSPEVLAEAQFMKATSYMELGEHKKAQKQIAKMRRDGIWTGYARHNYILAMFDGNSSGRSIAMLIEDATFYLPNTEEGKNLKDRIHLISALHFLQGGKNRSAEKHLKSISLDGPYTPAALLQYGWTMVEQGKYDQALQPWRELQTRYNRFDPEVMESMLGVPHVLELIRATTQSLKTYEVTESRLFAMKSAVKKAIDGMGSNNWIEEWIIQQEDQSWGWQANIEKTLPFSDTSALMKNLLVDSAYVNQITEYRDLVLLSDYLTEKEESLRLWLTLVAKREAQSKSGAAIPVIQRAGKELNQAQLELKHLQMTLANSHEQLFALPNREEESKINLIARSAKGIERLVKVNKASRDVEQYKQRWQRVKGVFLWQMNEAKPNKQWQLKKSLVAMDDALKRANTQLLETRLANQWAPSAWIGMEEKILLLLAKTSQLKQQALMVKTQSKQALLAESLNYLDALEYRINDYLSQARLSIARLYDDALQRYVANGAVTEKEQ
jgi:hypothetical protein